MTKKSIENRLEDHEERERERNRPLAIYYDHIRDAHFLESVGIEDADPVDPDEIDSLVRFPTARSNDHYIEHPEDLPDWIESADDEESE